MNTCDKCGVVYADGFDEDHDLMPCPLCNLKWDTDRKVSREFLGIHEDRKDRAELMELVKDLQEQINDIMEELDG